MVSSHAPTAAHNGSVSTADLVGRAAAQISTLVRDELAIAQHELMAKGKKAGIGGGLLGGAAVLALYGLGLLMALAVVGLDQVWPLWLAVLVVAVIVFAAAGIAALLGRSRLRTATPPIPNEAMAGISADVDAIRDAVKEGRQT